MLESSYGGADRQATTADARASGDFEGRSRRRRLLARLAFWRSAPTVVHECRRCGTTLASADADCPYGCPCDAATYVIE